MKILKGFLRNRNIKVLSNTRPTMAVIKESMFEILGNMEEKRILDLFAGSGSLSFEAISLGAKSATLIDLDRKIISNIISEAKRLGIENKIAAYINRADRAVRILGNKESSFDIIFIDPPYFFEEYDALLELIYNNKLLSKGGIIVLERYKKLFIEDRFFKVKKEKKFGSTVIMFLENKNE